MDELPRLTAAQAAARLGVKPESLYAYVSRGLLSRERDSAGSSFDPLEVEAFARRRRRSPAASSPAAAPGTPLMVLDTSLAHIDDDELYYRERPAARLARVDSFEEVVQWLWDSAPLRSPSAGDQSLARRTLDALGDDASPLDALIVAVRALAATDPLRADRDPAQLPRVGARLLTGLPAVLAGGQLPGEGVAQTLWRALAGGPPEHGARILDAALVLVIDHDLAVSTLAGRVAASARASGYSVVTAALSAFDAPLHGTASRSAAQMLRAVLGGDEPAVAIARALRDGSGGIPGFGQPLYAAGDMRASVLFELLREAAGSAEVLAAVDALADEVVRRADALPNLDLALAALTVWAGMPDDAGSVVFAIGRIAGWISHAMDEYDQRPMRLRPRGRYVGPAPA